MQTLPFISVIVPVRNEERYVAACLQSILAGDYPHEFMEILVVDGQSEDRTAEIVRGICARHPAVQLLSNPARVVPHAMNVGIRAARGALIVRIDAHAHYGPNYLRELVTWMDKLQADNVGGVLEAHPATRAAQAVAVAAIISHPFGVGAAPYRMRSADAAAIEVDTVPFGCYRREIFDRIGLFDERFIRNQDDELNGRLKKAGGRIFLLPHVRINYKARESLSKLALMLYQYGYFKPLVAMKLGRPATLRQLAPPAFAALLLALPVLALWWPIAGWLWLLVVASHVATNLVVTAMLARRTGWAAAPFLVIGFFLGHFAYGFGYLRGLVSFGLRRHFSKGPARDIPLSR